jgi:hypothetical protein
MSLTLSRGDSSQRASPVGTFTASFDVGQGLGGLVPGALAAAFGLRASFGGAGIFALASLFALAGALSRSARGSVDRHGIVVRGAPLSAESPAGAQ